VHGIEVRVHNPLSQPRFTDCSCSTVPVNFPSPSLMAPTRVAAFLRRIRRRLDVYTDEGFGARGASGAILSGTGPYIATGLILLAY
jgi:hypothetical protein